MTTSTSTSTVRDLVLALQNAIKGGDALQVGGILENQDGVALTFLTPRDWGLLLCLAIQSNSRDVVGLLLSKYDDDVRRTKGLESQTMRCQTFVNLKEAAHLRKIMSFNNNIKKHPPNLLLSVTCKPALHLAARHNPGAILPLIEYGCDVTAQDEIHGDTALHVACFYGNTEAVLVLLQNGADANATNGREETPLDRMLFLCSQPSKNSMERSRLKTGHGLWRMGFRVNAQCQGHSHHRSSQRQKTLYHFRKQLSVCKCVMSLQHMCRLAIRYRLAAQRNHPDMRQAVEMLHNVPRALKEFLLFRPVAVDHHVVCSHVEFTLGSSVL